MAEDLLADRIRLARKDAGLTREKLAQKLDVSLSTLINYETGRTQRISVQTLAAIAQATGKSIGWFFERAA